MRTFEEGHRRLLLVGCLLERRDECDLGVLGERDERRLGAGELRARRGRQREVARRRRAGRRSEGRTLAGGSTAGTSVEGERKRA